MDLFLGLTLGSITHDSKINWLEVRGVSRVRCECVCDVTVLLDDLAVERDWTQAAVSRQEAACKEI